MEKAQIAGTDNLYITPAGEVWQRVNERHPERRQWVQRKLETDKDGYKRVRVNGKNRPVHHLVYETFVGDIPAGLVVRHLDGVPHHNSVGNLCAGTQAENIADKHAHGTHQAGGTHPCSTITSLQAKQVKALLRRARRSRTGRIARGEHTRISEELGVSIHIVRDIHCKGRWACVE